MVIAKNDLTKEEPKSLGRTVLYKSCWFMKSNKILESSIFKSNKKVTFFIIFYLYF